MGHTPVSWDDLSGNELQPWSSIKNWVHLTENEKAAATSLGYTETIWDNKSGKESQPDVNTKYWVQLTMCPNGENVHPAPSAKYL